MSSVVGPGAQGEPLPAGAVVVRLAVLPKDYEATKIINPEVFALSSDDKASSLQALSVWHTELTTIEQARGFMAPSRSSTGLRYA